MYIAIFITCAGKPEAIKIAKALLTKKLVACVNIVDKLDSFFWWKGRIDKASEVLVILKTSASNFAKVEREVKRLHSYEVPEVVMVPITAGSRAYLGWIDDTVL